MPIVVEWYDDTQTMIHFAFTDPWGWEDFFEADQVGTALMNTANTRICFLIDFSQSRQFPRGMSLNRIRQVLNFDNPNSGLLAIYGMNGFVKVMINTMLAAAGKVNSKAIVVADREAAQTAIREYMLRHEMNVRNQRGDNA